MSCTTNTIHHPKNSKDCTDVLLTGYRQLIIITENTQPSKISKDIKTKNMADKKVLLIEAIKKLG